MEYTRNSDLAEAGVVEEFAEKEWRPSVEVEKEQVEKKVKKVK